MIGRVSQNGLTLEELAEIEEAAHRSQTLEAKAVLRLSAALREALQEKMSLCAFCDRVGSRNDSWSEPSTSESRPK